MQPRNHWIINDIVDFCEEHWAVFMQRMEEKGLSEDEVDDALEKLKAELGIS